MTSNIKQTRKFVENLQNKIKSLEDELAKQQSNAVLAGRIADLTRQNSELMAQVEQLRSAWEAVKESDWDAPLNEAFEMTPAQCLAEVKARAVEPIFNKLKAAHGETTHPRAKVYLCEEAFELAAEVMQLRQQVKDDE